MPVPKRPGDRGPRGILVVPMVLLAFLVGLPWLLSALLEVWRPELPYVREILSSAIILLLSAWIVMLLAREQRVTQRHLDELETLTLTDPLTGLGNRRAFERDLDLRLRHASRLHERIAILYMDVDGLKRLNDDFGHACGDETLRMLGSVLRSCSRLGSDSAYRVGGDEFAMIVSAERAGTDVIAHRIQNAFVERSPKSSRVSLGVVVWDGEASAGRLLDLADDRMYRHKGRPAMEGARARA